MPIPSWSVGNTSPLFSRVFLLQSRQRTQTKSQRGPLQAGDVRLGHSGGVVCVLLFREELSFFQTCSPQSHAPVWASMRTSHPSVSLTAGIWTFSS